MPSTYVSIPPAQYIFPSSTPQKLIDGTQKRDRPRRLIDTNTLQLVEFPSDKNLVPPYAILSHRWIEGKEVSYAEMLSLSTPSESRLKAKQKSGFLKIKNACLQAKKDGHAYLWADTCCIDDGNPTHKSQDINSMFEYYHNSEVCYSYLHDFNRNDGLHTMTSSDWFRRGWTLQELIAAPLVKFFDNDWCYMGDKRDDPLATWIGYSTRIPVPIIRGERSIREIKVTQRLSWSTNRTTTKPEDKAYSLLGMLGVTLEPDYGEGMVNAFRRLVFALREQYPDQMEDFRLFEDGRECTRWQMISYLSRDSWTDPENNVYTQIAAALNKMNFNPGCAQ